MKKVLASILFTLWTLAAFGQSSYWKKSTQDFSANKLIQPGVGDYQVFELDQKLFQRELSKTGTIQISLPSSQGGFDTYAVSEKSSIPSALSKKYPSIKTFRGYSLSDSNSRIALTLTNERIYIYVFSEASQSVKMIAKNTYLFYTESGNTTLSERISCGVLSPELPLSAATTSAPNDRTTSTNQTAKTSADGIRTLRLAIVAAGEYSEINGATKASVLANIVSVVNAVNSISELDLGINYELIENNDALIFLDKTTDPYAIEANGISTNSSYLNIRTQVVIDSLIGTNKFDLGHLFIARNEGQTNPYGIGNAYGIGNVGTPEKGSGWSYFSKSTANELGFIGLVSHEFGHHLGATHTFTNQADAVITQSELSSGRSIMSYGKINQPNLHYYHHHSINQIIQTFKSVRFGINFSEIGEFKPYAQKAPENINLKAYYIPIKTPFVLETPAGLTNSTYFYNWEQLEGEILRPGSYWGPQSFTAPLFSSTSPSTNKPRYFPSYDRIISNNLTSDNSIFIQNEGTSMLFETLPEVPRKMTFGLSVRDKSLLQGVYLDSTQVSTVANSKPFAILTAFTPQVTGGSPVSIEWEISNTNDSPIAASQVNILLSVDGGSKFDYLLAEKTANDGKQTVILPNTATTQARIKIEPVEQIFFTINPLDFEITTAALSLFTTKNDIQLTNCNAYQETIDFKLESALQTAASAAISFSGAPQGLSITLSKTQVGVNEVFTATVAKENVPSGTHTLTFKAVLNGTTIERNVTLSIQAETLSPIVLTSPLPAESVSQTSTTLKWNVEANATKYLVQVAKDPNFESLLVDKITYTNQYLLTPLSNNSTYYWRVYAKNACGTSAPTSASFTVSFGNEKELRHDADFFDSSNGIYPIQVTDSNLIKGLKFNVEISKDVNTLDLRLNDLKMTLTSPSGRAVLLSTREYTKTLVSLNSITYQFQVGVPEFMSPVYNSSTKKWNLLVSPMEDIGLFNGENTKGTWEFKVEGKSEKLSIGQVSLEFLSDQIFKAPSADKLSVYLTKNENKIALSGKNYLNQSLTASKVILNKFPTNGTLVGSQNESLQLNQAYAFKDVYFVPNQGFQGVDKFYYQLLDTDVNLESTTSSVEFDYKEVKPDLIVFDSYTSVKVGSSQVVNLVLKNTEYYPTYTFSTSAPQFGSLEINGNTITYQATGVGKEIIELGYAFGNSVAKSYLYINSFGSYSVVLDPIQELNRPDFGFRIGRTVDSNADGSRMVSSQNIQWEEGESIFNKDYPGLTQVFTHQGNQYLPLGDEIKGAGPNDRLGYRVSLSGNGNKLALATNHVTGCIECTAATDYVIVYEFDEIQKRWIAFGDKIIFGGQGFGAGGVDIQSVDLNFDGSILAVGNAREPDNGRASGAAFIFSFDEITRKWIQKGSLITPSFIGVPDSGTDFGAAVKLNKAGNRVVLNQPFSFFNTSSAGNVFVFEFQQGDWNLLGKPISGKQGFYPQFGKTVDINDLGDMIVISENYEVISDREIYLGKAYAYKFDSNASNWTPFGNPMRGPKSTIAVSNAEWGFTDENAKVTLSGSGNEVTLSLKAPENFDINPKQNHFIQLFNFDLPSSSWKSSAGPFATENHVLPNGLSLSYRPTYNETLITKDATRIFFGSGDKIGLPTDFTFIKFYEATSVLIPDTQVPSLVLENPYTLVLTAGGTAVLEPSKIDNGSTDNVGITERSLSKTAFTCADLGTNKVTFTAKDAAGNTSSAEVTVLVVDDIKPTLKAKAAYTLKLDAEGKATLKWEDIDEGSSDNCSIKDKLLSKTAFTCADLGTSKVTVTAKDTSGNTSAVEVTVTVVDDIKPTLKAKSSYTIKLDVAGRATLKWEDIDEGSNDNCSVTERKLSKTEFTRSEGGDNTVTYTVTDGSGNTSSIELSIRVDIVLSVPERKPDSNSVKVYPNPAQDYLNLTFADGISFASIRSTTLMDASGKVLGDILLEDLGSSQLGLSTTNLKTGLYFLRLSTRDTLHLIKFTVIH